MCVCVRIRYRLASLSEVGTPVNVPNVVMFLNFCGHLGTNTIDSVGAISVRPWFDIQSSASCMLTLVVEIERWSESGRVFAPGLTYGLNFVLKVDLRSLDDTVW